MRLFLAAILSLASMSAIADKQTHDMMKDMLISAKFSGMCGALQQMVTFQQSTKMEGGDKFIARFGMTEAARLGMTDKEFFSTCEKSIEKYSFYTKMAEDIGKE